MTTFSAILLDRFLEPKPTSSYSNNTNKKIPDVIPPYPKLEASYNLKSSSRRQEIPPPYPQLHRRNSTSSPSERVHIHPELYTTPEPTPLPDSPTSSFPPSPCARRSTGRRRASSPAPPGARPPPATAAEARRLLWRRRTTKRRPRSSRGSANGTAWPTLYRNQAEGNRGGGYKMF